MSHQSYLFLFVDLKIGKIAGADENGEKAGTRWDEIPCLDYRFHTPPPSLRVPQSNWPVCRGSANVCPPIYLGTTCVNLRQPR